MRVPSPSAWVSVVTPSAEYGAPVTIAPPAASLFRKSSVCKGGAPRRPCADTAAAAAVNAHVNARQRRQRCPDVMVHLLHCLVGHRPDESDGPGESVHADNHISQDGGRR